MFRKMRRFRQQLSEEECIRLLKEQPRGILSMMGENGYPYGIPLDHWYSEAEHKLFFHCAKVGHKLDAIAACDKVSYCVMDEGYRREGEWALNISSVVVFGRMHLVEDEGKKTGDLHKPGPEVYRRRSLSSAGTRRFISTGSLSGAGNRTYDRQAGQ